ncbi:hypothetical protein BDZ89DRAFT_1145535 [Hymenopellis radicata]|nr:hypothetical protein BDZ89DRAFT_1145535 [Hymenopellis radicata]
MNVDDHLALRRNTPSPRMHDTLAHNVADPLPMFGLGYTKMVCGGAQERLFAPLTMALHRLAWIWLNFATASTSVT